MKNRLHDKKAGIFITSILFFISLTETIIRGLQPNYSFVATELGQTFSIAIFSALILFFTLIKKDRICYICYAVFIGWFILEEAFSLPGTLSTLSSTISNIDMYATVSSTARLNAIFFIILRILITIFITSIGALMIEYMNDGSIYNKAFNVLCCITILLLLISTVTSIHSAIITKKVGPMLLVLNNLYRITMVFLFTFFAYDSAKKQLSKVDFGSTK